LIPAYLKWIDDFKDEQRDDGQIPSIIPSSGWGYVWGNKVNSERGHGPQWEGALMEIPWQIFQHTGDTGVFSRYYPTFKNYIDYLTTHSTGHLLDFGIDDHKQLEPLTQGGFLSSAFYYYLSDMFSKIAGILGNQEDASHYYKLAGEIKSAFNQHYYDQESGTYDHGGQATQALPLFFGLTEADEEEKVLGKLLEAVNRKNGHIDAGVVGTKAIINTLLKFGEERVLFEMANKRDFPGWGYWIDELGATTMFQNWDGSQSRNHIMFGTIGDYFFKGLAGINVDEDRPGFKHFTLNPSFDNDITWVEAGYESEYGSITSHWKKDGDKITLKVTIPSNCTAAVILPPSSHTSLQLNGRKLQNGKLEKVIIYRSERVRIGLGSGEYSLSFNHR
jgi:alpha-L-rhamnosidase